MNYVDQKVAELKNAENDNEIKEILFSIYYATQYDSGIRKEFDNYGK